MVQLLRLLCGALIGLFQSRARRDRGTLVLRQQINLRKRTSPKRPAVPVGNSHCRLFNAFFAARPNDRVWRWRAAARSSEPTADGHGPLAILRCRSIFPM